MAQTAIATLGPGGWIRDIPNKIDYCIGTFLTVNWSDTNSHRGDAISFQMVLQQNLNDMVRLEDALQNLLHLRLQNWFDDTARATVQVTPNEGKPDQFTVSFLGIINDSGKTYTAGKLVQFEGSRVLTITRLNNG